MKYIRTLATCALAGLMLLALPGWGVAADKEKLEIGMITSLTGTNANLGQDMERGAKLALKRINNGYEVPLQEGGSKEIGPGVLGKDLKLIVENTESRPQSAMDGVRKLVNVDEVPVVLGEFSSGITVPTGQFTNKNEVVHISVGATSPKLRDIGPYFFNAIGLDDLAGKAVAEFVMEDSDAESFGSIVPNNPFGVGVEINTCKTVSQQGKECTSKVRYELKKSDYRAEVTSVVREEPDAAFFTAYGTEARLILKQAYQLGVDLPDGWYAPYMTMWTNEVEEMPAIAEGMKGTVVGVSGEFYQNEYAGPYEDEFGLKPATAFGAYAYDATMLAAMAVEKAGSTDPDAVSKALKKVSQDYQGVTGDKTFDEDGMQIEESYQRMIYKDGELKDYTVD